MKLIFNKDRQQIEQMTSHLGSLITGDGRCKIEIKSRIMVARTTFTNMRPMPSCGGGGGKYCFSCSDQPGLNKYWKPQKNISHLKFCDSMSNISHAIGTNFPIVWLPLTPLITSGKHPALYISKRHWPFTDIYNWRCQRFTYVSIVMFQRWFCITLLRMLGILFFFLYCDQ